MQIAISLLISAMHLLQVVQGNPQLPQSFRDSAINIANSAIIYAQEQINTQNMPKQTPTNITIGSTIPVTNTEPTCEENLEITSYSPNSTNSVAGISSQVDDSSNTRPFPMYDIVHVSLHAKAVCSDEWYTEVTSDIPEWSDRDENGNRIFIDEYFGQGLTKMNSMKDKDGYSLSGQFNVAYPMLKAGNYTITMTVSNKDKSIVKSVETKIISKGIYK